MLGRERASETERVHGMRVCEADLLNYTTILSAFKLVQNGPELFFFSSVHSLMSSCHCYDISSNRHSLIHSLSFISHLKNQWLPILLRQPIQIYTCTSNARVRNGEKLLEASLLYLPSFIKDLPLIDPSVHRSFGPGLTDLHVYTIVCMYSCCWCCSNPSQVHTCIYN